MLNDPLSNVLSKILNYEKLGKSSCLIRPSSKIIKEVLRIMHEKKFIGEFKEVEENRGGIIKVELLGRINDCCVIKPRYSAKKDEFEKFEKRYLPAKGFGIIIVSTPKGIMTQEDAIKIRSGGILLSYCY
jgi:small subunit ribosomal protein S8